MTRRVHPDGHAPQQGWRWYQDGKRIVGIDNQAGLLHAYTLGGVYQYTLHVPVGHWRHLDERPRTADCCRLPHGPAWLGASVIVEDTNG